MVLGKRVHAARSTSCVRTCANRAASSTSCMAGLCLEPFAIRTSPTSPARRASSTARFPLTMTGSARSIRQTITARARHPTPSPARPRPSGRVAFTETDRPAARGRRPPRRASHRGGRDRRQSHTTVTSVDVGGTPHRRAARRPDEGAPDPRCPRTRDPPRGNAPRGRRGPRRPAAHRRQRDTRHRRRNARSVRPRPRTARHRATMADVRRTGDVEAQTRPRDGIRHRVRRSALPRRRGRAST